MPLVLEGGSAERMSGKGLFLCLFIQQYLFFLFPIPFVSSTKEKVDGMVRIYSRTAPFAKLAEAHESKQWVSDVKFSPDGRTLAVGAHDSCIQLYNAAVSGEGADVKATLSIRCKFAKHNSFISHFDFSSDSRFMQSTCGAYELLFSDVITGKQITSATELKDVRWSSWTLTLGWPVQV